MSRAHTPLSTRRTRSGDAHPTEVVKEWQQAAKEIARSPHQAEEIAWVESVSILFDECGQDSGQTLQ